tara:strand:- start:192 stop:410 length:219 start_codon:yes stop_codon:yes gene_type:complete
MSYPIFPANIDIEAGTYLVMAAAQPALPKGLQPYMVLSTDLTTGSVPGAQGRSALDNPYLGDVDFDDIVVTP